MHAHSRGQASVALSSCEAEVMAASEGIKEALLRILPSTRCRTHEAHRFENLVASRLDCCGRCEIEEDTENTELDTRLCLEFLILRFQLRILKMTEIHQ